MPNQNIRAAWVNNSNYIIPVYSGLITRPGGGYGAGGTKIGSIYPAEFYTTAPRTDNACYYKIYFRNSRGVQTLGYIETQPGGWGTDFEPWTDMQAEYVYYNSNGSYLQPSSSETIGGSSYRVFTVKKAVTCLYPDGSVYGIMSIGDKLATYESTAGQSNPGYMLFHKRKRSYSSTWENLTNTGYGFVNLGLNLGSEPSNRAIW